ncbi:MAG: hypothetical protein QOE33_1132 [Acidobacteriota bacterium]|nr:hypothetical protein [Acidobacteriota bacterium]
MQNQDRENFGEEANGEAAEGAQEMGGELDFAEAGGPDNSVFGADPPIIVDGGGNS